MATHENEQLLSLPAAKLPARTASEPLTAHLAPSDGAEGGTTTAQTLGEGRSEAQAGGAVRARDFHQQAQPMTLNGEEQGAATPERHDDRDRTSTSNGSLEAAQLAASQEAQLSYHRRRVAQARAQRAVSSAGGLERRGYHENGDDGSDTDGSDGSAGPEQSQQRPELSVSTSKGGQPSPSLLSPPQSAPLGHHPQQPRRRRGESAAIRPGSKLRSAASMPADLNSIAKRQHSPLSPKQGGKRTAMAPLSPSLFPPGFGARGGRSRSASTRSSAPLLPKQLQPFEFVIEPKPAQNQNTSGYDRANGASTSADAQAQQGSAYPYGGQPEASAQGTAMSASAGTFPDVMFHLGACVRRPDRLLLARLIATAYDLHRNEALWARHAPHLHRATHAARWRTRAEDGQPLAQVAQRQSSTVDTHVFHHWRCGREPEASGQGESCKRGTERCLRWRGRGCRRGRGRRQRIVVEQQHRDAGRG